MSKADELIAGLATDGQFDSDGAFSLDRDKAREKMRQFQLADPHRYVLLLVEAAVLRGATTIVFDIDADDMHMRFDAPLSWADLDELYGALFVNRTSDEIRARRELALACNAVMALNPRWVKIESFVQADAGPTCIAASLRSDAKDEIRELQAPTRAFEDMPRAWTDIHVKERFRPGLLVRFLRDVGGSIPEEQLLRARCQHASTAITLDGVRISEGLPSKLVCATTFETEHLRGVAGIDLERRDSSGVVLLSNGVHINTHELAESINGLWYWVDASRFRKDVSQGDIVRGDPAYEEMLQLLARGRDGVLGKLAERWHAGEFGDDSQPSLNEVFDLLRGCFVRWADANWLRSDAGPLGQLARMPLWRTVDRQWLSPVALVEQVDPVRGFMYTERDFEGVTPQGWGPVIHVLDSEAEIAAVRRVYPQADSSTDRLEREVPWELARRKWRARPHALELPRGLHQHPISFEQGEYRGVVAIRPGQLSHVRVLVDGCLLCEVELDLGGLGVCAVITGPLTPAAVYSHPRADRDYATLLLLLLAQLPKLIGAWAGAGPGSGDEEAFADRLYGCLLAVTQDDFAARYLVAFGFTEATATKLLERLGTPVSMPPLGLGEGQVASAVAKLVSFPTVDARRASLAAIDLARREREREPGKLLLVDRAAPSSTGVAELLLHVDADDRRLLTLVFGAEALHDDTKSYVREIGRREFEAKPEREPSPPPTAWTTEITLEHGNDRISGHVGVNAPKVREWQASTPRRMSIELFTRNRSLCTLDGPSWVPAVEASLAWDGALINADYNGIEGARRPLFEAVERGLIQILSDLCGTATAANLRPPEDERRLLWLAIVSPFVSVEHFRAWRALRAHFAEHSAAVTAYCEVMELFPGVALKDMIEAIKLLLDDGKLPDRATLLSLLDREVVPPGGGREFQRAVLDIFPLLESVPLLDSAGSTPLSLARVLAAFEQTGKLAYIEDRTLKWDDTGTDARVIVRADEVDQVALIRLFGRETFTEVSGWIQEQRSLQRFESRAQLEHLRVPDSLRLVGVEFERDGFCGELAVPDRSTGEGAGGITKITFCHERRVIEEIELHAVLPVIGIVDDAHAELTADYSKVDPNTARMAALRKLLDELLANELLPRLAEQYEQFDARKRSVAWTWIASHWRRSSMRAGQHPNRLTAAGKLFAQLRLFQDTDGQPRSLAELTERFNEQRQVWYVERHPGHSVAPPFPIVEARGDQLALLRDMFPLVEDFGDRWRACVAGDKRRLAAKPLPPLEPPSDALVSTMLQRNELRGAMWIPARHPFVGAVTLGAEGKLVEVCELLVRLPTVGIVGGALRADDAFESVLLSGVQRRYLESQAVYLYNTMLVMHERELARSDKVDFLDPALVQRRAVRLDILRAAAIELRRAELLGEGADAILGSLQKRLFKTALLRLNTGRLISIDVAIQARPQELAHLGIWSLDGPILEPAERARLLLGEDAPPAAAPPVSVEPPPALVPSPERSEPAKDEMELGLDLLAGMMNGVVSSVVGGVGEELDAMVADVERELLGEPSKPATPPMLSKLFGAPEPAPPLPEPTPIEPVRDPVAELLDRIRGELRLLRERHEFTLSEGLLDGIRAEPGDGKLLVAVEDGVLFDSEHPRFGRALDDPDPIWVSFLASVAYTALNHWLEQVSDDDELEFHAAHATLLLSALLDGTPS